MPGLYGYRWQQQRAAYLKLNPWCVYHLKQNKYVRATVVDHIKAHKQNLVLFWDQDNWQPLCKLCHDSHKQHYERTGHIRGCDTNGHPIDPNHHWNTEASHKSTIMAQGSLK